MRHIIEIMVLLKKVHYKYAGEISVVEAKVNEHPCL